jgi:hypothetical protein
MSCGEAGHVAARGLCVKGQQPQLMRKGRGGWLGGGRLKGRTTSFLVTRNGNALGLWLAAGVESFGHRPQCGPAWLHLAMRGCVCFGGGMLDEQLLQRGFCKISKPRWRR